MSRRRRHGSPRSRTTSLLLAFLLLCAPASAHALLSPLPLPIPLPSSVPSPAPVPSEAPAPIPPTFTGPLSVTSGDMADTVRVSLRRTSRVAGWRIERAAGPTGPWKVVISRTAVSSVTVKVPSARTWYYRVRTVSRSGARGAASAPVANDTLSLTRVVGRGGATMRASNGSLVLVLPAGAFASSARVTVRPASAPGDPALVRVTSPYEFSATQTLRLPATVTMRYRVPVSHFQVAATVARGIDWMCLDTATGTWSAVPTTVDTAAGTLSAAMPHFSYWIGVFIQPHGTTPAKTDYCGTVCHNLAISPLNVGALPITDSQVCYNCHGNTGATMLAAGSNGANIQGVFWRCSGQTVPAGSSAHPDRAPGATAGLKCTLCHDPHADPVKSPKLLRAFDALTGRAIASVNSTVPGSPFCWACHGVRKNAAADASVPGYYARTGDKKTKFVATPHDTMNVAGKGCSACHAGHTSSVGSLVKTTVAGRVITDSGRSLCVACHEPASRTYPGGAMFATTAHAKTSGFSGQALAKWPGRTAGSAGDCANCHDPHGTGNADYTRAAGNALCLACHDDASIVRPGASTYRGAATYATSVHAGTACAECHAVHGSSDGVGTAPKLMAGRQDQACIACHTTGSSSTRTTGTAPRTWNGRDLAVEFSRPSHHPVDVAAATLAAEPETVTVFQQASAADFALSTLDKTQYPDARGLSLAWGDWMFTSPAKPLILMGALSSGRMDAYDPATNEYNVGYDPADNALSGGTSEGAVVGNTAYFANQRNVWRFGLDTDAWASSPKAYYGGVSVDKDAARGLVYILNGNQSNKLYVWDTSTASLRPDIDLMSPGGAALDLGTGALAAYSPQADRLFVVNVNYWNGAGDGHLYYLDAPWSRSGAVNLVDTGLAMVFVDSGTYRESRLECLNVGGTDYLFALGRDASATGRMKVLSGLSAATPTVRDLPWAFTDRIWNAGVSVTSDGTYLYVGTGTVGDSGGAIRYARWAKVPLPAHPMTDTWAAWTELPLHGAWGAYPSFPQMLAANVTPPALLKTGYPNAGTVVSPEIAAPVDALTWGTLAWDAITPANTALSLRLEAWNGSAWVVPSGAGLLTGGSADLTGLAVGTYPKLRVTGTLATSDYAVTPRLVSWSVSVMRKGRRYVAGTIDRPSMAMLAAYPALASDTYTAFTGSASLVKHVVDFPAQRGPMIVALARQTASSGTTVAVLGYDPAPRSNQWFWMNTIANNSSYSRDSFGADGKLYYATYGKAASNGDGKPGLTTVDAVQGGAATDIPVQTPALGTVYAGHDAVYVPRAGGFPASAYIQVARAVGDPPAYSAFRYDLESKTWGSANAFYVGGSTFAGQLGGVAYLPGKDRLFMVAQDVSVGSGIYDCTQGFGRLVYYDGWAANTLPNPPASPINGTWTALQVTYGQYTWGSSNYAGKLEIASKNATDVLVYYGPPITGSLYDTPVLQVISDLGGAAPVRTVSIAKACYGGYLRTSADLTWDGGDYLYLENGDPSARVLERIAIPSDPTSQTLWAAAAFQRVPDLPAGYAWTNSSSLASLDATIPAWQRSCYETATVDSGPIRPNMASEWGWLNWTPTTPARTSVSMRVQWRSDDAAQWQDVAGMTNLTASPVDLGALSTAAYPQLRVLATLATADWDAAPSVAGWTVTAGSDRLVVRSDQVLPPSGAVNWATAEWNPYLPPGTDATMTVYGWSSASSRYVPIPGFTGLRSRTVDLRALRTAEWPKLVLEAWGTKSQPADPDPTVRTWSVAAIATAPSSFGSTTCGSCHDAHVVGAGGASAWDLARISDPADTKNTYSTVVGGDVTSFCLACHTDSAPGPGSPVASVPATQSWSRQSDRPLMTSWSKTGAGVSYALSAHANASAGDIGCETCHDPHGSDNAALAAWTRPAWFAGGVAGVRDNTSDAAFEENLCYQCHGNGTTVGRKAAGAPDVATPASQAYSHPIAANGRHTDSERLTDLGSANRHSECVDCHDPHAAQPGVHTVGSSQPAPALRGAVGVKPIWPSTAGAAATSFLTVRFTGAGAEREAYLCLKCHSSATSLSWTDVVGGASGTDLTREFNPANSSYHNVLGFETGVREYFTVAGSTFSWAWVGDSSLKSGMTRNSKMTCTDCHTSMVAGQARGPHGSSVKYLIDPGYSPDWTSAMLDFNQPNGVYPNDLICTKCHYFGRDSGQPGYNAVHSATGLLGLVHTRQAGNQCTDCHNRVPHGGVRPRLLAYTSDPAPYKGPYSWNPGIRGIKLKNYSPTSWVKSDCDVGCSSTHGTYAPSSPPYYP